MVKRTKEEYERDDGFVIGGAPKSKKQKKASSDDVQKDADGNVYWELSGKRRVQISEYKGATMVNIREFYEKDDQMLPGKKGISLSIDQYKSFVSLLPEIERALAGKGVEVPRPEYDAKPTESDVVDDDGVDAQPSEERKKPNFEATSEEDDG